MIKTCSLLFAGALLAGMVVACGGSSRDLSPARLQLPTYPNALVSSDGTAPRGMQGGNASLFRYDRDYIVDASITQDDILNVLRDALTQAGWQEETPAMSRSKDYRDYCTMGWIKCSSFVKDETRVLISVPLVLNFNPLVATGADYHAHLEEQ